MKYSDLNTNRPLTFRMEAEIGFRNGHYQAILSSLEMSLISK